MALDLKRIESGENLTTEFKRERPVRTTWLVKVFDRKGFTSAREHRQFLLRILPSST